MITFKNVMAIGLFLFGTTFMWMTASFAGRTRPPDGAVWTVENILALVAVIGFAVSGAPGHHPARAPHSRRTRSASRWLATMPPRLAWSDCWTKSCQVSPCLMS